MDFFVNLQPGRIEREYQGAIKEMLRKYKGNIKEIERKYKGNIKQT